VLALVCLSQASNVQVDSSVEEMRANLISFLSQKTEGVVQEVLELLEGLVTHAENDIVAENKRWAKQKAALTATLNKFITLRNEQEIECNRISKMIANYKDEISERRETIVENVKTMKQSAADLAALLNRRCEATKAYIRNIKNNRETLGVLEVVQKAIQNFHPKLLQVSDLQSVMTRFGNFINLYAKEHKEVFAQLMYDVNGVNARTKSQIGNSYKDNNKGMIHVHKLSAHSVEKLSAVKAQLMSIVEEIRSKTKAAMKEQQEHQIQCNSNAANFEGKVEREARRLTHINIQLSKEIVVFQAKLKEAESFLVHCQNVLRGLIASVNKARQNLKDATIAHNNTIKRLDSELALFKEVVQIYKTQVIGAAAAIKARIEDYSAHKNFKATSGYTKYKVTEQYHHLHGKVGSTVASESK
jgi:hypothetical protein